MSDTKWNNVVASRQEQYEQKRLAVLEAGVKLFNDQGYERTSLDDIANSLNITKRTIYYYVQSKDEILFECMKIGFDLSNRILTSSADQSVSSLDRIKILIDEYTSWVATDFGACIALLRVSALSPERRAELNRSKFTLDERLRNLIRQGIDDGTILPCDPKLVSAAIFGAMNWLPYWNRTDSPVPNDNIRAEFARLFVAGLTAPSASLPR